MGVVMGFFSRFKQKQEPEQVAHLEGPGEFKIEIVGESLYQDNINDITGGKTEDGHRLKTDAILLYQYDNPHDNQAIAVTIKGKIVGHLDRKMARLFRGAMKKINLEGYSSVCKAIIVGGWDRGDGDEGHYGVRLGFPYK